MPITRSKGRAPASWTVDLAESRTTSTPAVRHEQPPRSPSATATDSIEPPPNPTHPACETPPSTANTDRRGQRQGESDSARTLRPGNVTRTAPRSTEDRQEPSRGRADKSVTSARSNKRILKAREDLLKIKLQLAEIELQKAEEEEGSDGYVEDGQSKAEYVRSWLEEAPEPQLDPDLIEASAVQEADMAAAPPPEGDLGEQNRREEPLQKKKDSSIQGGDPLTPLITGLTSAIAALADRKPLELSSVVPHPAVSKVIMTLPTFDGAHTEWLSFRAIYDTTKKYFNDVENTARLRKSLKGRALETVNSELIAHARPTEIMKELELQFGRPDSIAQAESDKMRNLPRCGEAPKDICAFAGKVRSGVVTLEALKRGHYLVNSELLRALTEKLPNSLRVQWYRAYTEKYNSTPDLRHFSEFVTEYARFCSAFAPAESTKEAQQSRRVTQRTHTVTEADAPSPATAEEYNVPPRFQVRGELDASLITNSDEFRNANADRRWELAKKHSLCFRCLRVRKQGHSCKPKKCGIEGCTTTHHRLLHYQKKQKKEAKIENQETVASSILCDKRRAFLKIVPVHLVGPAGEVPTFALLDDGSTVSLIDEQLAQSVGAEGKVNPFVIRTIGDAALDMRSSRHVNVTLRTSAGTDTPLSARTVPSLRLTPQEVRKEDIADCKHLTDIKSQLVYNSGAPQVLIGQDNWHLLVASDIRQGPRHQPVASLTPLGWVLHGAHTRSLGHPVHLVNQISTTHDSIEEQLKKYFALESLIVNPRRPKTDPEKIAEDILEKHTRQLEDSHIETALLWKTDDFVMPDSYENAIKRLASIEKKLGRSPELKSRYTEQMNSLIEKGYAEEAPLNSTPGKTWYLPHFDVHNPMKPEKLRIVHDAAAKTRGVALNDFLLTGPDLLQSLPGVMMRFRRHCVAVTADICEMFMQVRVRTEDRDALRYLWRGDRREGAPQEYRMKSIIFGAASSPCTAIFVKNWNARKHVHDNPEAVEAIIENHYMDDYLDSFRDEITALRVARSVRDIHRQACFELKKWVSNSQRVVEEIESSSHRTETVSLVNKGHEEKILGLMWEPSTDELSFNLKLARLPENLINKKTPTKREALKIVMSLYDPLGLASPVTVRAKQIMQEVWRLGIDWDEQFNENLAKQWSSWLQCLEGLKIVKVPRCYPGYSDATSLQLHVFVDASEAAYVAAAYWRVTTPDGRTHVTLVMAKARVAPLKITSIPRLELQAAVLGTRVATAVIEEHRVKPEATIYWSDSKTVLTWIRKGSRAYKPFVAHRLAAIEEHSRVEDWRWVPTKLNIADAATRDVPADFNSNHEWYTGPSFLYEGPSQWPTEKNIATDTTGEERTHTAKEQDIEKVSEAIPDPNRFSRWERLLRATARVLQFIALCRKPKERVLYKRTKKKRQTDPDWRNTGKTKTQKIKSGGAAPLQALGESRPFVFLSAEHTRGAEDLLVKAVQGDSFGADLRDLRRGRGVARDSRLRSLSVEYTEGVITLRSRIAAAEAIPERTKKPPVLDGEQRIVKLYIDWTHRSLHHSGTELVINEIRQHYWVLRLRPIAKQVIHGCLQCRIRKAQPPEPATGQTYRRRALLTTIDRLLSRGSITSVRYPSPSEDNIRKGT